MKAGDKVVCVIDGVPPNATVKVFGDKIRKGLVYVIRETFAPSRRAAQAGEVVAVTLVGVWAGIHFDGEECRWRGSYFRPVSEVGHPPVAVERPAQLTAP